MATISPEYIGQDVLHGIGGTTKSRVPTLGDLLTCMSAVRITDGGHLAALRI